MAGDPGGEGDRGGGGVGVGVGVGNGLGLGVERREEHRVSLKALFRASAVAAGIQFGYGLQLSLLTPYVQELGISHEYASYIWLCGPISGLFVQPIVGHYSDACTSSYGRRRPFIVGGAAMVIVAVFLVGFSKDLGHVFGDSLKEGEDSPWAIFLFVVGFWILDLANNTLQAVCRALLADFTGKDARRSQIANAFFSLFIGIGNVLGFLAGAFNSWASIPFLKFTRTDACQVDCSNLKSAFLVGSVLLISTTTVSVTAASEIPWKPRAKPASRTGEVSHLLHEKPPSANGSPSEERSSKMEQDPEDGEAHLLPEKPLSAEGPPVELVRMEDAEDGDDNVHIQEPFLWELVGSFRKLPRNMWYVFLMAGLTWIAWFPFILYDTDWMGREVYLGKASDPERSRGLELYDKGVHRGAIGLMLNSVVLGVTSIFIDWMCLKVGSSRLWGLTNIILVVCFASTALITRSSLHERDRRGGRMGDPSGGVVASALLVFTALGMPFAVLYSVPYALTATFAENVGVGQGVAMGMLSIAICLSQLTIAVVSGPVDSILGNGSNIPSFLMGAASAACGCVVAFVLLRDASPSSSASGLPVHSHVELSTISNDGKIMSRDGDQNRLSVE